MKVLGKKIGSDVEPPIAYARCVATRFHSTRGEPVHALAEAFGIGLATAYRYLDSRG